MSIVEEEIREAPQIALRAGQVLGDKYVLDRLIGKGGMAVVWAGSNERTGKRVALKVIRRSFATNNEVAELFRREALAASRVNHPNVVNVFDVMEHEGLTCIVMELLDGEPLNDYLARKGPLSAGEAAALLLPAMRGVAAANAQGVVHRDLKPQNIFLCVGPDGRFVTTKVLDFGISVIMEKALGASVTTVQLATLGTPAYMSPEHIAGALHIDQRADVYGFGVLFYEALAGQHPFPGAPGPALFMRILHEPPPPLASLRPDLPFEAVHIIECAMAKEPSARFPDLNPFIRSVEDHLLPSSVLPRSLTPLAGVPVYPLSESGSGVADSVVQVARRAEPSAPQDTQAIYNLPRASTAGAGEPSRKSATFNRPDKPSSAEPPTEEIPTLGRALRRFFAKPVVVGVIFAAILSFVIWMAFPMPGRDKAQRAPAAASPAATVRAPESPPVKAAQPLEPTVPAASGESGAEGIPAGEIEQAVPETARGEAATAKARSVERNVSVGTHAPAKASSGRTTHGHAEGAHAGTSPATARPAASAQPSAAPVSPPPAQPSAPTQRPAERAGSLSPDEF